MIADGALAENYCPRAAEEVGEAQISPLKTVSSEN
jgi:hypothetical protein